MKPKNMILFHPPALPGHKVCSETVVLSEICLESDGLQ